MPPRVGQVTALVLAALVGIGGMAALAQDAPPLAVGQADPVGPVDMGDGAATDLQPQVIQPGDLTINAPVAPADGAALQILTVDQNALFSQSAWGHRLQAEFEHRGAELEAENNRLVEQLSTEEAELTELRKTLPADEFRTRADAFDVRATRIRRERAQAVQDLNARADAEQQAFFGAAVPVMGRLMQELGAVAVLDRRSVLISVGAIDITDKLIARVDAEMGDGSDQPEVTPQTVPGESGEPTPPDPVAPQAPGAGD